MLTKMAAQLFILFSLLLFTSACSSGIAADPVVKDGPVPILGLLSGDLPITVLQKLLDEQQNQAVGYFSSQKQLDPVLSAIQAGGMTLPAVDFPSQLVLFTKNTQFYNRIQIGQVLRKGDTLTVLSMETRSAKPITNKLAVSLAVIERDGARFIDVRGEKLAIAD